MPSGPVYSSDLSSSTVTYTVPSLPSVALSLEPLPSVSVSKAQPVVPPPVVNPSTTPAPVPCGYRTPGGFGKAVLAA